MLIKLASVCPMKHLNNLMLARLMHPQIDASSLGEVGKLAVDVSSAPGWHVNTKSVLGGEAGLGAVIHLATVVKGGDVITAVVGPDCDVTPRLSRLSFIAPLTEVGHAMFLEVLALVLVLA